MAGQLSSGKQALNMCVSCMRLCVCEHVQACVNVCLCAFVSVLCVGVCIQKW